MTAQAGGLFSGEALDRARATDLARRRPHRVMLLLGPHDSGKTTLLASMHELFQKGEVGVYSWAGSKTYLAFEQRCHLARAASMRKRAHTTRTRREIDYLHLALRRTDLTEPTIDFLLPDISGELFDEALDSNAGFKELGLIGRADRVALLVDGERLTSDERHVVVNQTLGFVRAAIEAHVFDSTTTLDLVFTKADLFASKNEARSLKLPPSALQIQRELHETYAKRLGQVSDFVTAARPASGSAVVYGYGVRQLLDKWMRHQQLSPQIAYYPTRPNSGREFDNFGWSQ